MSVTSGFFNSLNHDRRYNAQQFSALFDGIINDGVFANIGVAFAVNADSGVTINIGVGKAWFNSAWVYNDALLPKTLEGSEVVLDRIDAVVIEVDHSESVRLGDIKIVKGTPSSNPQRPAMADTTNKHQHPLAYIYRKAGSTEITQADITNMVGTSSCPYITGILQVQNIDNIVAQWEGQWNKWYSETVSNAGTEASAMMSEMKSEFDIWFNDVKTLLEDDVATALAAQVAELQGKFDTLAREGAVYDIIEDFEFDAILGSDGTPLQGKTVMGGGGGGTVDMDGLATKDDLNKKVDKTSVVNDFTVTEEGYVADARALKALNDGKLELELLYVNPKPSDDFAATSKPIPIPGAADYDYFMITFDDSVSSVIRQKGKSVYPFKITATKSEGLIWVNIYYRSLIISNDGLTAGNCQHAQYNGSKFNSLNTTAGHMRPHKIYGMKGVPV